MLDPDRAALQRIGKDLVRLRPGRTHPARVLRRRSARIALFLCRSCADDFPELPDHLQEQLASEAKARRVTKSWLVRETLEKALCSRPGKRAISSYDVARDLAGSVKGLPKDLADNPKYMEGFGE